MREIKVYTLASHKKYLVIQRGCNRPVWINCVSHKWYTVDEISNCRIYGGDVISICTKETHPEYYL